MLANPLVTRIHARRRDRQRNAAFVAANLLFILTCVGYAVKQAFA
jgi:hypothetical protein